MDTLFAPTLDAQLKEVLTALPQSYIDWGTQLIQADKAWAQNLTGKKIKVGLIDTGIDYNHSDLAPNVKKVKSFIDNTGGIDSGFHGTHVAGIIAGAKNGTGIIGVAPEAEIYAAKIFDKDGYATSQAEFAALEWMASEGVHVVNMSYGCYIPTDIPEAAAFERKYHDLIKEVVNAGTLLNAASGNNGKIGAKYDTVAWPSRFPEVFAVGAISQQLQRAEFSSAGGAVEFAMPGVDVYSCYPGNLWARLSGTSMASPYLTGCIALLQQWAIQTTGKPMNYEQMKRYLVAYAKDLGVEGLDVEHGYGKVNIGKIGTVVLDKTVVKLDQPPVIYNGRTLAPVRFVIELAGGVFESFDGFTKTMVFVLPDGRKVTMQADNQYVEIVRP